MLKALQLVVIFLLKMSAFTHGVIFVTEFETLAKGHLDTEDTTSM